MRWKPLVVGSLVLGLCAAGVRVGARMLLRERETQHEHTARCGDLVHRVTTTLRQGPFDATATLVRSDSEITAAGRVVVNAGITDFQCLQDLAHLGAPVAAVLSDRDDRRNEIVLLASDGTVEQVLHVEHPVARMRWSEDAQRVSAIGPDGELSVAERGRPTRLLARDAAPTPVGVVWSSDAAMGCWVRATAPVPDVEGSAELLCFTASTEPASVQRAAWSGAGNGTPWAGYYLAKPRLCGEDLQPRDVQCRFTKPPAE